MKMRTKVIIGFLFNLAGLFFLVILTLGAIYFFGNYEIRRSILNWLDPSISESDFGFVNRGAKLCGFFGQDTHDATTAKDVYVGLNKGAQPVKAQSAPSGGPDNPYPTLGQALCAAEPGWTVHVRPGVYAESIFLEKFGQVGSAETLAVSGDTDHLLKIVGETESDGEVVLDGQNKLTYGLALIESQNILVRGLTFKNYTDAGLLAVKSGQITIDNNIFTNNGRASIEPDYDGEGFGLHVGDSRQVVIKNNQVYGNGPGSTRRQKGDLGTGIDTFSNQEISINNNNIHDNFGGGILVEDSQKVKVEFNKIQKNDLDATDYGWWDAGIWVDGGRDVALRSNLIQKNRGPAIEISDEEHAYQKDPPESLGFLVTNNQLRDNYYARFVFGYGVCPDPPEKVLVWRDNVEQRNTTDKPLLPDHDLDGQYLCLK